MFTLHERVQKKESNAKNKNSKSNTSSDQSMSLQGTLGNKAVQKLINLTGIQAKLNISNPEDSYEKEADTIAEEVINMPDSKLKQQKIQSKPLNIQRKTNSHPTQAVLPNETETKINSLQGGVPLSKETRAFFEPRFGTSLASVRIHTNTNANNLASSINARAFTKGNNIVFNSGEYTPQSHRGKKLLGHELTHTIQQEGSSTQTIFRQEKDKNNSDAKEKALKSAGEAIAKHLLSKTKEGQAIKLKLENLKTKGIKLLKDNKFKLIILSAISSTTASLIYYKANKGKKSSIDFSLPKVPLGNTSNLKDLKVSGNLHWDGVVGKSTNKFNFMITFSGRF